MGERSAGGPMPAAVGSEPGSGGLAGALHRLATAWAAEESRLAHELALTPTDYLALKHLLVAPAPLGAADLARRLGMSTGSAHALVNRLEARGHLRRERHPTDRRRLLLTVTPTAQAAIVAALRPLAEHVERASAAMSSAEVATVIGFLERAATRET